MNHTVSGSQVLAQAFMAAAATVDPARQAHAMHGAFLRAGDSSRPLNYQVERDRDGGSYSQRSVIARQNGGIIFRSDFSFKIPEDSDEHQLSRSDQVRGPEGLQSWADLVVKLDDLPSARKETFLRRTRRFELRPVHPEQLLGQCAQKPENSFWIRILESLPAEPAVHLGAFTYLSNYMVTSPATIMHVPRWGDPSRSSVTLNHAIWYHRPLRADQWLLFSGDSPSTNNGRGVGRGDYFTEDGMLVASVAQEITFRRRLLQD